MCINSVETKNTIDAKTRYEFTCDEYGTGSQEYFYIPDITRALDNKQFTNRHIWGYIEP